MPLIMVDTNVSLRATIAYPGGIARKLWTVFSYGAAAYGANQLGLDEKELESRGLEGEGVINRSEQLIEHADRELARLQEVMPIGTPEDLVLVGSQALWDEYQRKALETARKLGREITAFQAEMLRAQYEAICVAAPRPHYAFDVPALTADPDDDILLFDALRVGADIFVSEDPDVIPDSYDGVRDFSHGESKLRAMKLEYFYEHHCSEIDWEAVPAAPGP